MAQLPMPSLRTRTVLRLMLLTGLRYAWTVVKGLVLLAILFPSVMGLFGVNLWSFQVLETAWNLHAAGTTLPPHLRMQVVGVLVSSTLTLVLFWCFVWRNRGEPEVSGALINSWVRGLPNMRVDRRSSRRDKLVMWAFSAGYLANAMALFATAMLLTIGVLAMVGVQTAVTPFVKGWQALSAPLPSGVNVPVTQRAKLRLTQLWDRHAQQMLDTHPDAYVRVEQQMLRDALRPDAPEEAALPRRRL